MQAYTETNFISISMFGKFSGGYEKGERKFDFKLHFDKFHFWERTTNAKEMN